MFTFAEHRSHGLLSSILILLLFAGKAHTASLFTQLEGTNYMAWEAENYSTLTNLTGSTGQGIISVNTTTTITSLLGTTILPSSTNASGRAALLDNVTGINYTQNSKVSYEMTFLQAGTYSLYARVSVFEISDVLNGYGNEDSFFVYSTSTFADTASPSQVNFSATVTSNYTEGTFGWLSTGLQFTVDPSQVGNTVVFSFGDRETGAAFDRFALSMETGLGAATLDGFLNAPEPGKAALLLMAVAAMVVYRRRPTGRQPC